MTDESPDTEEQLTSQDFIKEGPIERGVELDSVPIVRHPPGQAVGVMLGVTAMQDRADMFKAMAFEADKEAKRLQGIVNGLHFELKRVSDERSAYRAALLDIEGRVATWRDSHWFELQEPGNMQSAVMLAILAVVKRVK